MKKYLLTKSFIFTLVFTFATITISLCLDPNYTIILSPRAYRGVDDLVVDLHTNQSRIGKQGGALVTLNITNQGLNPVVDVQATFNLTGAYGLFSSNYPIYQEINQVNPLTSASINVEVISNITQDPKETRADVCLLFDASGSMGEEIGAVKAKFLKVTNRLAQEISSLRVGMIVYGWERYSEYPTSSPSNYIEFTENIKAVNRFIQGLYAAGGKEPWGDAFWLANSWTWREDAQKLIIIVGDEDCDIGNIVGQGSSGDYYNGTQLLNIITGLKEKKVQINAVLTQGYSGIVKNQFTWITEYTGGVCVELQELETGENPITLPELIEQWTLKLVREYALEVTVELSWTEVDPQGNIDHTLQKTLDIWIDFAPPSISYSKFLVEEEDGTYSYDIYTTPRDISGIAATNLYWTKDDLNTEADPTWYFKMMELLEDNKTYFATITDLIFQQKVSFYMEAMDSLGNVGKTAIENATVVPEYQTSGTINEFMLLQENATQWLHFASLSGTEGFLWIRAEQTLITDFESNNELNINLVFTDEESEIYELKSPSNAPFNFSCMIRGNKSLTIIRVYWAVEKITTLGEVSEKLDKTTRTILWKANLSDQSSKYLSLIIHDSELVAKVYVFSSDWIEVGNFTATTPLEISTGTYYLWVIQIVRTGQFSIVYDETPFTDPDKYQEEYEGDAGMIGSDSSIFIIFAGILCCGLLRIQKIKKKRPRD